MPSKSWVQLYTDGSCIGNPGPGAWGCILQHPDGMSEQLSGVEDHTTNNRMELLAVCKGLAHLWERSLITVYTDSQYVQQGITHWVKRWQVNGWKNSSKRPVANMGLWKQMLIEEARHSRVIYNWIPGHDGGFPIHDKVDKLVLGLARRHNQNLIIMRNEH